MTHFCGEITYFPQNTRVQTGICFNCNPDTKQEELPIGYRNYLHACLEEWLNKSNGTGAFWLGDPEYFSNWKSQEFNSYA